jgi:hypothetical protein
VDVGRLHPAAWRRGDRLPPFHLNLDTLGPGGVNKTQGTNKMDKTKRRQPMTVNRRPSITTPFSPQATSAAGIRATQADFQIQTPNVLGICPYLAIKMLELIILKLYQGLKPCPSRTS